MFKGQKGITLVAVALATLSGNNNIISNANNAVEKYNNKAQADNNLIEQVNALLNTYMTKK